MTDLQTDGQADPPPVSPDLVTVSIEESRAGALIGLTTEMLHAEKLATLVRDAAAMEMTPAALANWQRRYPAVAPVNLSRAAADVKLTPTALANLDAAGQRSDRGVSQADWAAATGRDRHGRFIKQS